ncbi:thioredoxin-like protein [Xylariales sp. PMI_506]|nr:thioredoxin-like protein [Xylariales sp. PMI_506]
MSLEIHLKALRDKFEEMHPIPAQQVVQDIEAHHAAFDYAAAIQVGDVLPAFTLPNDSGENVSSIDLLDKSALLITFYRGSWCSFCSLTLASLQENADEFHAKGVKLVAISPMLPMTTVATVADDKTKIEMLSDVGSDYARKLGILWTQSEEMRPVYDAFGQNLRERNGTDSYELPVPTSLLVDREGVVRYAHVDFDFTRRLETSKALEWAASL